MSRKSTVVPLPSASSIDLQFRFFSSLSEGVIAETSSGEVIYQNAAALRLLSFDPGDLRADSGSRWLNYIDHDGQPISIENTPAKLALKTEQPQENRIIGKMTDSKITKWFSVTAIPLFDEASDRTIVISTLRDVTEETELKLEFEKLRGERKDSRKVSFGNS